MRELFDAMLLIFALEGVQSLINLVQVDAQDQSSGKPQVPTSGYILLSLSGLIKVGLTFICALFVPAFINKWIVLAIAYIVVQLLVTFIITLIKVVVIKIIARGYKNEGVDEADHPDL